MSEKSQIRNRQIIPLLHPSPHLPSPPQHSSAAGEGGMNQISPKGRGRVGMMECYLDMNNVIMIDTNIYLLFIAS